MVQKRKTGRKAQTKTKPNVSLRRLLPIVLICILAVSVMIMSVRAIQQHNQKVREKQAQLTRLNAAADDLKKVYDELLTTLPNIREHSFEKSCVQSSDVLNNGTITCGAYGHLVRDNVSAESFVYQVSTIYGSIVRMGSFISKDNWSWRNDFYNAKTGSGNFTHKRGVECSLTDTLFNNAEEYNKRYDSGHSYKGGIESITFSCYQIAREFLPQYLVDR